MNDIEREIEKDFEEEQKEFKIDEEKEESKEETKITKKLNYRSNDDKKKKIILISLVAVLLLALGGLAIYLITSNKKDDAPTKDNNNEENVNKDNEDKEDITTKKVGYVSCTGDTSLLNVRSSAQGDIIDGLSCFKKVDIEEETEGTDTCAKWYKISYKKYDKKYTGYACGTYIKEDEQDKETTETVRELLEKANDYYDGSRLVSYCGQTSGSKKITFTEEENTMEGEYRKSEYKTIKELKDYLLSFMEEDLIDTKLELSDIDNPKYYDNYYEIDGNLYCRNYAGKGYKTNYTKNYDIEITTDTSTSVVANIAYEYLKEDSKCDLDNLSKCPNSNFVYEIGKIKLTKEDNNYIITKLDFHK